VRRGFVNGMTFHIVGQNGAGFQALGSHSGNAAPWGEGHHAHFHRHFGHAVGVLLVGDDLPQATNRVTLSDTLTDSSGLPAARIAYRLHENDARLIRFAGERARELAAAADAWDLKLNDFGLASAAGYRPPAWHLLGTARMGDDPAGSVTNKWHQAWDCANLYIVDGSSLPTGGAVNPTSTISALALRAATHLRDGFAILRRATTTAA
jgi:choline dehydrogenase-like flavoprotein